MVTTTALLADLVKNVGGDWVEVGWIVPPGADVHSFQTTPEDSIAINRARVIVSNGFGLDASLAPVLRSARSTSAVNVIAADGLAGDDPHFWHDPEFAIHYVERIRDGLAIADPDHGPDYQANAETYMDQLRKLDQEITLILSQVPPHLRNLVTYHDAFNHFARHYGWRVSAFVSSDADEVSPAAVVQVLERVSKDLLPAVFIEPEVRSDVILRAAKDAGVAVGTIYAEVSGAGVTSYIEMMRFNAQSLAELLR